MTSIPIFPLNVVLYPGSLLPLKIFEQRYLEMTKVCVRDASPFGVCLIREGREVGLPAVPQSFGCTAVISEWEMPQLGVFHLKALGAQPFRILRLTTQTDGLIRADIEMLAESAGSVAPASFALCRSVLEQIIRKIGVGYVHGPVDYDDPRWTGYRLAELLPLELADKQALLELRDDGARIERLHTFLMHGRWPNNYN